jgi:hypothetical protein
MASRAWLLTAQGGHGGLRRAGEHVLSIARIEYRARVAFECGMSARSVSFP